MSGKCLHNCLAFCPYFSLVICPNRVLLLKFKFALREDTLPAVDNSGAPCWRRPDHEFRHPLPEVRSFVALGRILSYLLISLTLLGQTDGASCVHWCHCHASAQPLEQRPQSLQWSPVQGMSRFLADLWQYAYSCTYVIATRSSPSRTLRWTATTRWTRHPTQAILLMATMVVGLRAAPPSSLTPNLTGGRFG